MSTGKKPGIKTHELATELGLKPRAILDTARSLGIPLQNRLTRMDSEAAQRIGAQLHAPPGDATESNPAAPTEDAAK